MLKNSFRMAFPNLSKAVFPKDAVCEDLRSLLLTTNTRLGVLAEDVSKVNKEKSKTRIYKNLETGGIRVNDIYKKGITLPDEAKRIFGVNPKEIDEHLCYSDMVVQSLSSASRSAVMPSDIEAVIKTTQESEEIAACLQIPGMEEKFPKIFSDIVGMIERYCNNSDISAVPEDIIESFCTENSPLQIIMESANSDDVANIKKLFSKGRDAGDVDLEKGCSGTVTECPEGSDPICCSPA